MRRKEESFLSEQGEHLEMCVCNVSVYTNMYEGIRSFFSSSSKHIYNW